MSILLDSLSDLDDDVKETFCIIKSLKHPGLRGRQIKHANELIASIGKKVDTSHNQSKINKLLKVSEQSIQFQPEPNRNLIESFRKWWEEISWFYLMDYVRGWWDSIRLLTWRELRIEILAGIKEATSTLVDITRWGGLVYVIPLFGDIFKTIRETFKPPTDKEEKNGLTYSDVIVPRFISVITEKDDNAGTGPLWYRFINNFTWFDINLIGILIILGLVVAGAVMASYVTAVINLIGFSIDVVNETSLAIDNYRAFSKLQTEIEKKIKQHEEARRTYQHDLVNLKRINAAISEFEIVKKHCVDEKIAILRNGLRVFISLSLLVLGMYLIFFPPLSIIGAKFIGGGMALLFGSVITGCVPRMWRWGCERYCELFNIDKKNIDVWRAKLYAGFCLGMVCAGGVLTFLSMGFPALLAPGLILMGSGLTLLAADVAAPSLSEEFFKPLGETVDDLAEFLGFRGPAIVQEYELHDVNNNTVAINNGLQKTEAILIPSLNIQGEEEKEEKVVKQRSRSNTPTPCDSERNGLYTSQDGEGIKVDTEYLNCISFS